MNITKPQAALIAAALIASGILVGRLSIATPIGDETSDMARSEAVSAEEAADRAVDEAIAAGERAVADLEAEYDRAMDDLYSPAPPADYRPDPEIRRGQRQAVELNEMICKETGQNCEAAAMARRHYEETYGPM